MFNLKNTALVMGTVLAISTGISASAHAKIFGDNDELTNADIGQVKIGMVEAIQKAQAFHKGTIVEVEFEKDDGQLIYEIKYLDREDEEDVELIVNAMTGEVNHEKDHRETK